MSPERELSRVSFPYGVLGVVILRVQFQFQFLRTGAPSENPVP